MQCFLVIRWFIIRGSYVSATNNEATCILSLTRYLSIVD